jgi:hypothetical protein
MVNRRQRSRAPLISPSSAIFSSLTVDVSAAAQRLVFS